jgi:hypothetical protein
MKITYRKDHPKTAKTWFAKVRPQDSKAMEKAYTDLLIYLSEKSLNTDSDVWQAVSTRSKKHWGFSNYEDRPNNLLSVLGGIVDKLRKGGDLTEKQLAYATLIGQLMPELGDTRHKFTAITFEESLGGFEPTGDPIRDLQERLFETANA